MTTLVLVGDASDFPKLDTLPSDMFAVCGYIGGDTPRIWKTTEVEAVQRSGRQWWPIFTAPSRGQRLTREMAVRDGYATLSALRQFPMVSRDVPVFCDIEYITYTADRAGALAYLTIWKTMLANDHWRGFGYLPWEAQLDWVAKWDNVRPTSLPSNCVGKQYSGKPGIDYSVMDLDRLGVQMSITDADVERIAEATRGKVSATLQQYIPAELGGSIQRLVTLLGLSQQEAADIAVIKAKLTTLGTPSSGMSAEDEHAFAVEIAQLFGSALSKSS